MFNRKNYLFVGLVVVISLFLVACGGSPPQATAPTTVVEEVAEVEKEAAPTEEVVTYAEPEADTEPVQADVRYLLTTAEFAADKGYLTATRAGEGLMQIRRPRYESEQTHWLFTPDGEGYYHLRQANQTADRAYNDSLVAVETAVDDSQLWQITPLDNDYYRLTNKAAGEVKSLTALGENMPYPGWGEVALNDTDEVESQYWILEVVPDLVAENEAEAEDEDDTLLRGAAESVATVIDFETFGSWKRGDQPYGDFSQSEEQTQTGSSGKLHYDFGQATEADDFVIFLQQIDLDGEPNLLTAQVYGDGSGHFLNAWIMDAEDETWAISIGRVTVTGWQGLAGEISPTAGWPSGHISGPQNGQIDYPLQFLGLLLDRVDVNAPASGNIYLDDLTFTIGELPAAEAVETESGTTDETTTTESTASESVAEEGEADTDTTGTETTETEPVSAHSYELIPLEDERDDRLAEQHGDLNLRLRELQPIDEALGLVQVKGDTDKYAPNFVGVLEPNFVTTYSAHNWDWGCNCPSDLIENPWGRVAAVEIATTPDQSLYIPRRKFDIYQGKFYAVLLYASEDSLTFVYAREGNISNGYAIHYQGLTTDPNLLKLYRESQGDNLPGLTLDTPLGTAGDKLMVAIRDRGSFMDPRTEKDWWVDRGLPRPPTD